MTRWANFFCGLGSTKTSVTFVKESGVFSTFSAFLPSSSVNSDIFVLLVLISCAFYHLFSGGAEEKIGFWYKKTLLAFARRVCNCPKGAKSSAVNDQIGQRVLAKRGLHSSLDWSDLALLEGLDGSVLEAGANDVAPTQDITPHHIALVLNDRNGRANGLAVGSLVKELPDGKVSDQTITCRHG
jgi:hypothetical protein